MQRSVHFCQSWYAEGYNSPKIIMKVAKASESRKVEPFDMCYQEHYESIYLRGLCEQ